MNSIVFLPLLVAANQSRSLTDSEEVRSYIAEQCKSFRATVAKQKEQLEGLTSQDELTKTPETLAEQLAASKMLARELEKEKFVEGVQELSSKRRLSIENMDHFWLLELIIWAMDFLGYGSMASVAEGGYHRILSEDDFVRQCQGRENQARLEMLTLSGNFLDENCPSDEALLV
jgi:hypothetical protein